MSVFTPEEIDYLREQTLGRLATVGPDGQPHVTPVTFHLDAEEDTVDVGGLFFGQTIRTGDYVFFSVTTLTTTGYGNLVPAGQPGRMIAGLEMLVGQIFLVTLIAGLVSLWRPGSWRRGRRAAPPSQEDAAESAGR